MSVLGAITSALPLAIRGFELTDPVLTLFGDTWSLNVMCPWTVDGPEVTTSWESDNIEDEVWELVGQSIVDVIAGPDVVDPTFLLSGNTKLTVHADTDLDPWTLSLPTIVVTGRRGTQE